MPVEAVHLIERHNVEHLHHFFLVKEVAGDVEHVTAVAEVGFVGNGNVRQCPVGAVLYF